MNKFIVKKAQLWEKKAYSSTILPYPSEVFYVSLALRFFQVIKKKINDKTIVKHYKYNLNFEIIWTGNKKKKSYSYSMYCL